MGKGPGKGGVEDHSAAYQHRPRQRLYMAQHPQSTARRSQGAVRRASCRLCQTQAGLLWREWACSCVSH